MCANLQMYYNRWCLISKVSYTNISYCNFVYKNVCRKIYMTRRQTKICMYHDNFSSCGPQILFVLVYTHIQLFCYYFLLIRSQCTKLYTCIFFLIFKCYKLSTNILCTHQWFCLYYPVRQSVTSIRDNIRV